MEVGPLGEDQRAVGEVPAGVHLAADVTDEGADLEGAGEGLVGDGEVELAEEGGGGGPSLGGPQGRGLGAEVDDGEVEVAGGGGLEAAEGAEGEERDGAVAGERAELLSGLEEPSPRSIGAVDDGRHPRRIEADRDGHRPVVDPSGHSSGASDGLRLASSGRLS